MPHAGGWQDPAGGRQHRRQIPTSGGLPQRAPLERIIRSRRESIKQSSRTRNKKKHQDKETHPTTSNARKCLRLGNKRTATRRRAPNPQLDDYHGWCRSDACQTTGGNTPAGQPDIAKKTNTGGPVLGTPYLGQRQITECTHCRYEYSQLALASTFPPPRPHGHQMPPRAVVNTLKVTWPTNRHQPPTEGTHTTHGHAPAPCRWPTSPMQEQGSGLRCDRAKNMKEKGSTKDTW